MTRRLAPLCAVLLSAALATGGEVDGTVDPRGPALAEALSGLGRIDGMHGGTAGDMQTMLGMVQTPEMLALVDRLNAQLGSLGTEADAGAIDRFVRTHITREDVERLLGIPVTEEQFNKAIAVEMSSEQLEEMLRAMQGGGN